MSRISEAMARAGRATPAELPSIPASATPTVEATFAPSDVEEAAQPREAAEPAAAAPVQRTDGESADASDTLLDPKALPNAEKLVFNTTSGTPVEQYRRLAGRLLMAHAEHGVRIVMITSALPGEGKTLTATNLALTLSESYKRSVLLIDADLRRPGIHQVLQLPNVSGLNDGLRDGNRKVPLIQYTEHLSVLTAGRPEPDPMSVLSGERMTRVIEEAAQRFEWVIVDTPPVALLTDAHLLASRVDAVLLVVETGQTPLPAIKTAVQSVGRERILGVVMNRADGALHTGVDYYGNYAGRS